jgi:hypothetical protein
VAGQVNQPFELRAQRGLLSGTVSGVANQRVVTITLLGPTRVNGLVLGADGKPLASSVSMSSRFSSRELDTNSDGTFVIDLPRGNWSFSTPLNVGEFRYPLNERSMNVTLGTPPGTCGVVVDSDESFDMALLVPVNRSLASVGFHRGAHPLKVFGIPCGEYHLFLNGKRQIPVSIRSAEVHVTLPPDISAAGEP